MRLSNFGFIKAEENEKDELEYHFKKYASELGWHDVIREENASRFINAVFKNPKRHIFWALSDKYKKCAFGILTIEKGWPETSMNKGRIAEIYVFPEYRRKGVGTFFVKELIGFLKENRCFEIEINVLEKNTGALHFWHSLGFADTKRVMKLML
jgi:GNAT superfamily N-acetyltransferase